MSSRTCAIVTIKAEHVTWRDAGRTPLSQTLSKLSPNPLPSPSALAPPKKSPFQLLFYSHGTSKTTPRCIDSPFSRPSRRRLPLLPSPPHASPPPQTHCHRLLPSRRRSLPPSATHFNYILYSRYYVHRAIFSTGNRRSIDVSRATSLTNLERKTMAAHLTPALA